MRTILSLMAVLMLTSCAGNGASEFFDRLEFEEGQEGCIRASGQVSVGSNPLVSSSINISMVKTQGQDAPDC